MTLHELQTQFDEEVLSNSDEVDPTDQFEWESLAYGWALAKGASIDEAYEFSIQYWIE